MAESYLFNPTEGINKAASQVQASLGNIFSGIIAQKQNDYNIAEKTFENINALTDKLGEYGQQEITSKTTSLLDDAARSIIKNGKLDYSEVGRIRNGVSTIKNRKSAIEAGTQMYKEMAQTALATKDDLLNLGVTLDGMRSVILNPENLSAEDMGRQMQSVYQKNINTTKVMTDILGRVAPKSEYAQTYIGADKGQYAISGTKVSGWELDPVTKQWKAPANVPIKDANGNVVLNPDGTPRTQSYLESITNAVRQQGAPAIAAIRAQMGENSVFQTDEQIVDSYLKQYVQGNNTAQKDLQVKSADELRYSTSRANVSAIEEKNLPTKQTLENQQTRANIGLTEARTRGENLSNQLTEETISSSAPLENMGITVKGNEKNVNFGQSIQVNSVNLYGKMTPFVATDLSYDAASGKYKLKGRPAPKGTEGKWAAEDLGEQVEITISRDSRTYKNFISAINGPALSKKTYSLITKFLFLLSNDT